MRILSRKTLKEFWIKHPQAEEPLKAWVAETEIALWNRPQDIKNHYRSADFLKNNRVIFNRPLSKLNLIHTRCHPELVSGSLLDAETSSA